MNKKYLILRTIAKLRILPSWLILFIDILLLIISSFTSYVFFKQLGIKFYQELPFEIRYTLSLIIYIFYFLVFKTYIGIIRYSTLNDIGRLFKSIFASFLTIVIIDSVYKFYNDDHIFVFFTVFYSSFFIFFTLISFRIVVKLIFQKLTQGSHFLPKENK